MNIYQPKNAILCNQVSFDSKNTISKIKELKRMVVMNEWSSLKSLKDFNYKRSNNDTGFVFENTMSGQTTNMMNKRNSGNSTHPKSSIQNVIKNKFYKSKPRIPLPRVVSRGFQSGYTTSYNNFNLPPVIG